MLVVTNCHLSCKNHALDSLIYCLDVHVPLLYYVHVHLNFIVATRKAFDVKNMYKSLFHRKCTVAAAHNLSVHACFSSIGNIWENLSGAISCLFTGQLKRFLPRLYHFL